MIGLVTTDDILEVAHRKSTPNTPIMNSRPTTTGQYSRQSGRWNETPKSANRSRLLHRRTLKHSHIPNQTICVDEHEREVWVILSFKSTNVKIHNIIIDVTSTLSNLTNGKCQ